MFPSSKTPFTGRWDLQRDVQRERLGVSQHRAIVNQDDSSNQRLCIDRLVFDWTKCDRLLSYTILQHHNPPQPPTSLVDSLYPITQSPFSQLTEEILDCMPPQKRVWIWTFEFNLNAFIIVIMMLFGCRFAQLNLLIYLCFTAFL